MTRSNAMKRIGLLGAWSLTILTCSGEPTELESTEPSHAGSPGASAPGEPGVVHVSFTTSSTGSQGTAIAVPGVRIRSRLLANDRTKQVRDWTDDDCDGIVRIETEPGYLTLDVDAPRYLDRSFYVGLVESGVKEEARIDLEVPTELRGRVVAHGEPIPNAEVLVWSARGKQLGRIESRIKTHAACPACAATVLSCDDDGTFSIGGLESSSLAVIARVGSAIVSPITFVELPEIDEHSPGVILELPEFGALRGWVSGHESLDRDLLKIVVEPDRSIHVWEEHALSSPRFARTCEVHFPRFEEARIDEHGRFEFPGIPLGFVKLSLGLDEFLVGARSEEWEARVRHMNVSGGGGGTLDWPGIPFVTESVRVDSRNDPPIEIHGKPAKLVTIRVPLLRPIAAVLPWRVEAYLADPKNDSMRLVSRCEVDRDEEFAELRVPTRELVVVVRSDDAFGVVASGHVAKDSSLTTGSLEHREAPTPWVAGSFLCVDAQGDLLQSGWLKIETNGIPPSHARIEGGRSTVQLKPGNYRFEAWIDRDSDLKTRSFPRSGSAGMLEIRAEDIPERLVFDMDP